MSAINRCAFASQTASLLEETTTPKAQVIAIAFYVMRSFEKKFQISSMVFDKEELHDQLSTFTLQVFKDTKIPWLVVPEAPGRGRGEMREALVQVCLDTLTFNKANDEKMQRREVSVERTSILKEKDKNLRQITRSEGYMKEGLCATKRTLESNKNSSLNGDTNWTAMKRVKIERPAQAYIGSSASNAISLLSDSDEVPELDTVGQNKTSRAHRRRQGQPSAESGPYRQPQDHGAFLYISDVDEIEPGNEITSRLTQQEFKNTGLPSVIGRRRMKADGLAQTNEDEVDDAQIVDYSIETVCEDTIQSASPSKISSGAVADPFYQVQLASAFEASRSVRNWPKMGHIPYIGGGSTSKNDKLIYSWYCVSPDGIPDSWTNETHSFRYDLTHKIFNGHGFWHYMHDAGISTEHLSIIKSHLQNIAISCTNQYIGLRPQDALEFVRQCGFEPSFRPLYNKTISQNPHIVEHFCTSPLCLKTYVSEAFVKSEATRKHMRKHTSKTMNSTSTYTPIIRRCHNRGCNAVMDGKWDHWEHHISQCTALEKA
ncbi:unnamed protein product [Alternaria alternata]